MGDTSIDADRAWQSWVSAGCTDAQADSLRRALAFAPVHTPPRVLPLDVGLARQLDVVLRLFRATLGVDGAQLRALAPGGLPDDVARVDVVGTVASTFPTIASGAAALPGTLDSVVLEWDRPLGIPNLEESMWRALLVPERTALAFLGMPVELSDGTRCILWAWSRWRREWSPDDSLTITRFASSIAALLTPAPLGSGQLALRWRDSVLAALANMSTLALVVVDHATSEVLLYSQPFLDLFRLHHLDERLARCDVELPELERACSAAVDDGAPGLFTVLPRAEVATQREVLPLSGGRFARRISFAVPEPGVRDGATLCDGYVFEDFTARIVAERALRDRTEMLAAVINSSPLALVATDRQGRVLLWSRAAERIFGWAQVEVIGSLNPAIPPGDERVFSSDRDAAFAGAPAEGREVTLRRRDGRQIQMASFSSLMPVSEASPFMQLLTGASGEAVLTAYADLSERLALEEKLRQSQKVEVIGRIAAGVAHDFNNLLTAIVGYCDLALQAMDSKSVAAQDVREVRRTADRATDLTRKLLNFARRVPVGSGYSKPSVVIASLAGLITRLGGEGVSVEYHLDDEDTVAVDAVHLEQVIINLVVNARDAMPDGGNIFVSTTTVAVGDADSPADASDAWRPPAGLRQGRYVGVSVGDTGIGIAPEVRDQIFEPFFTTKGEGTGTGLGLSVTADIVRHAGGGISVESTPNAGTRFDVYLPIAENPPALLAVARPVEVERIVPHDALRILLVEDDETLRALLGRVLREAGFHVIEARNGSEALTFASTDSIGAGTPPPDVLVCNVMMPRQSGREIADTLSTRIPGLRVVLISGHAERLVTSAADRNWETLQKPFSPIALVRTIEVLAATRRA